MESVHYTHAMWRVKTGREEDFIAAWHELSEVFRDLEKKPLWGSLLQNLADSTLFYSFGPWNSLSDIEMMRTNPEAQAAVSKLRALCLEATPNVFRLAAHIDLSNEASKSAKTSVS